MTKNIKQTVLVAASPQQIYGALLTSKLHSKITGDTARVSRRVGGAFTAFGGYATGKNVELIPGEKIVQTWRASDWPKGVESKLTISLSALNGGTKLTFVQTGVPADQLESIKQGWVDYYWDPLVRHFTGTR